MTRQPKTTVTVAWDKRLSHKTRAAWKVSYGIYEFPYLFKADAVKHARAIAKRHQAELIVKNKNGRIGWRNSYGNDPKHRKG